MTDQWTRKKAPRPSHRRLRAFAFDPMLSRRIETQAINEITIRLPWADNVEPGPRDDYFEVVDYDPASQVFYAPLDLDDRLLLAQDGLPPSEANPQFHQQMVYAVASSTIRHFETALGRRALWSSRLVREGDDWDEQFVKRLRIYPHALREANAYYSPAKKALLFGYFPASITDPGESMPGEMVFTCLSHDVVAHETTHALLDGLHRRFIEPTNIDVWALHEGFADIVALFQHFSYPEVLRHQIARTRGDLERQNLLAELAYQFGQAIGRYSALRSALGQVDRDTGQWIRKEPDPKEIRTATEPHARGAILVAAVFDAFLTIYQARIADLLRIATGGSGVLPPGALHPDLVERLAQEAAKTARHILHICIRALDYCPPVDVDFGDYLRALITADADLVADDTYNYRPAFIEAFRRHGIYPRDVRNLSEEGLLWQEPNELAQEAFFQVFRNPERGRSPESDGGATTGRMRALAPDWGSKTDREAIFRQARKSQALCHHWFSKPEAREAVRAAHLVLDLEAKEAFYPDKQGRPALEVHSVRPARRIGPDGQTITELVVEMTQRRRGYYSARLQDEVDQGMDNPPQADFIFRGGCTLLIDPDTAKVRYCIYKRILSKNRLDRMRRYLLGQEGPPLRATYSGDARQIAFEQLTAPSGKGARELPVEPLALLHRSADLEEVI